MCGIAGMYLFKKSDLQQDYFRACLSTMKHRGPDAQAIWHNAKNYITAFARLAIRDISPNGNQPMLSDCGNYCITYNGEIYNTVELNNLLKPFRENYRSTSDTELLLYALIHLGVKKTLQTIDGIFAFAFYDAKQNSLVLARDRVGVKPLYAGINTEGFVYSSQYDHIINHPYFSSEALDERAIGSYLQLGYIPENYAAIKNTKMLRHGYYYTVANGKMEEYLYYDYPLQSSQNSLNNIDEILCKSVNEQLVSDVPVGTFMSGGVDSTLVTYFANRHRPVLSFTIGVRESEMDETEQAKAYAEIFKTKHNQKYFSRTDLLNLIEENTKAFTEPFADFSSLPVLMLSKFAREKATVALSGDGGDELFWGYPRHLKILQNYKFYSNKKSSRRRQLVFNKISGKPNTDVSRHWNEEDFLSYCYHTLFITGALKEVDKIFNAELCSPLAYETMRSMHCDLANDEGNAMNMMRKLEMEIHLQRILLKVDRASMYHSLEVRVPLLSNAMLAFSSNTNYTQCIQNGSGKMNLKKSLIAKTNEQLVMQPKKGFVLPIGEWISSTLKNDVQDKILNMPASFAVMFKKPRLEKLISDHIGRTKENGWMIWALYALVNWHTAHKNNFKH